MPHHATSSGYTLKHARIPTIRTGSILRYQACTSLRPACAWFNNNLVQTLFTLDVWKNAVLKIGSGV